METYFKNKNNEQVAILSSETLILKYNSNKEWRRMTPEEIAAYNATRKTI